MSKINLYLVVAVLLLFASFSASLYYLNIEKEENHRLKGNQEILINKDKSFSVINKNGLHGGSTEALNLKVSELTHSKDSLLDIVKKLGISKNRLLETSQTVSNLQTSITTQVRDSVLPGRVDTLRCIDYKDPWLEVSGCIHSKIFTGEILSRDTLTTIVHRIPKKFLFFKFGCKAVGMDIVTSNPHTKIIFSKYIRLE